MSVFAFKVGHDGAGASFYVTEPLDSEFSVKSRVVMFGEVRSLPLLVEVIHEAAPRLGDSHVMAITAQHAQLG